MLSNQIAKKIDKQVTKTDKPVQDQSHDQDTYTSTLQRARVTPSSLTPNDISLLQRTLGNQALKTLVQRIKQENYKQIAPTRNPPTGVNSHLMQSLAENVSAPVFENKIVDQHSGSFLRNGYVQRYTPPLRSARSDFKAFTMAAASYGLPVKFLQRVGKDYTAIVTGFLVGIDYVNPLINTMFLNTDTLEEVKNLAPASDNGIDMAGGSSLGTIYHEATHAYLDLVSDTLPFRDFINTGKNYYKGAKTVKKAVTTDSDRVFHEAAASYVETRIRTWWNAFTMLSYRLAKQKPFLQKAIDIIKKDYNKGMADRSFGYSDEGGFLGFGDKETPTARPISKKIMTFLDQHLLENKIPDNFDSVIAFKDLISKMHIS